MLWDGFESAPTMKMKHELFWMLEKDGRTGEETPCSLVRNGEKDVCILMAIIDINDISTTMAKKYFTR